MSNYLYYIGTNLDQFRDDLDESRDDSYVTWTGGGERIENEPQTSDVSMSGMTPDTMANYSTNSNASYPVNGSDFTTPAQLPNESLPDILKDLYEGMTLEASLQQHGGGTYASPTNEPVTFDSVLQSFDNSTYNDWNTLAMRQQLDQIMDEHVSDIVMYKMLEEDVPDQDFFRFHLLMRTLRLAYEGWKPTPCTKGGRICIAKLGLRNNPTSFGSHGPGILVSQSLKRAQGWQMCSYVLVRELYKRIKMTFSFDFWSHGTV